MFQEMSTAYSREVGRYWWAGVVQGVLLIVLGLIALLLPRIALVALIFTFGTFAILDGIFAIVAAMGRRHVSKDWGWRLVQGILSLIIGILAFAWPAETALILLLFIAAWAIVHGITQIGGSIALRGIIGRHMGVLLLSGILSILFGLFLFIVPGVGLLAILWTLGVYGVVCGILLIIHSFQVRSLAEHAERPREYGGGAGAV